MTHTEVLESPGLGAQFVFMNEPAPYALGPRRYFVVGKIWSDTSTPPPGSPHEEEELGLFASIPDVLEDEVPWIPLQYEKPAEEDRRWLNASFVTPRQAAL